MEQLQTKIWTALLNDPRIIGVPEPLVENFRPFVEDLPTILVDHLTHIVSVPELLECRMLYIEACIEKNFISRQIAAMTEEDLGGQDKEIAKRNLTQMLTRGMAESKARMNQIWAYYQGQPKMDQKVMSSDLVGLSSKLKGRYEQGSLTVLDVLCEQPGIIVFIQPFQINDEETVANY